LELLRFSSPAYHHQRQQAFVPAQECIDAPGQFEKAARLGALVVVYLHPAATLDNGRDGKG